MWDILPISFRGDYASLHMDCSSMPRASSMMDDLSIECFVFIGIKLGPIEVLRNFLFEEV